MSYPTYPAYKDSGVAWLGEVPSHWALSSVRKQFSIQLGKMLQNDASSENDLHVTYLKAMHVNWERVSTENLPRMWASPKELGQYGVQAGDLLVCEGGEAGRAGFLPGHLTPAAGCKGLSGVSGLPDGTLLCYEHTYCRSTRSAGLP